MESVQDMLPMLSKIIEGLGKHFGAHCEFVIHDYSRDFDSSLVAIVNKEVTGRDVGQGGTGVGLRIMKEVVEEEGGRFNYLTQTRDGRYLRSSTIYLKNEQNVVMGSICINLDITELISARNCINQLIDTEDTEKENDRETVAVYTNVEDQLLSMIEDSISYVGTPVALMTREQKISGISYLEKRGAFKIKKAAVTIAKYYGISRYTVYNYLEGIVKN